MTNALAYYSKVMVKRFMVQAPEKKIVFKLSADSNFRILFYVFKVKSLFKIRSTDSFVVENVLNTLNMLEYFELRLLK